MVFWNLHIGEGGEGLRQDVVGPGLGRHGLTDHHDSVPHIEHGLQLADLLHKPVRGLQVVFLTQILQTSQSQLCT